MSQEPTPTYKTLQLYRAQQAVNHTGRRAALHAAHHQSKSTKKSSSRPTPQTSIPGHALIIVDRPLQHNTTSNEYGIARAVPSARSWQLAAERTTAHASTARTATTHGLTHPQPVGVHYQPSGPPFEAARKLLLLKPPRQPPPLPSHPCSHEVEWTVPCCRTAQTAPHHSCCSRDCHKTCTTGNEKEWVLARGTYLGRFRTAQARLIGFLLLNASRLRCVCTTQPPHAGAIPPATHTRTHAHLRPNPNPPAVNPRRCW